MEPVTTRAASMQYNFVKQNELCLKCFYTNANSLVNKIEEFKQRVHGYDIISVSETWFHSDIGNAEMALDGYNMYIESIETIDMVAV